MISHILNSGGNNSLMKHDVVQGNNIVDLDGDAANLLI